LLGTALLVVLAVLFLLLLWWVFFALVFFDFVLFVEWVSGFVVLSCGAAKRVVPAAKAIANRVFFMVFVLLGGLLSLSPPPTTILGDPLLPHDSPCRLISALLSGTQLVPIRRRA
jgi:hypothetical protein